MIIWEITTSGVKGLRKGAVWQICENYKTPTEAITHFLGGLGYGRYKEKHIIKIEKIKL